jgi:cytochrome c biogenesis protein
MRTAFYLLIVIAAGSLLATVLPQQQEMAYYQERYGPFLSNIILRLGFDHVSTAAWFLLLLALLMLSLVACTGNLWSIARARWRIPGAEAVRNAADRGRGERPATWPLGADEAVSAVCETARRHGYHTWDAGTADGARCVYLCRHRWSAWGATLAHYAVFLIGIGALMGALPSISVDEYVEIPEGQASSADVARMPFQLRLNAFSIEVSPETGAIANYFSDLSVIENGQEVLRKTISVNRPLRYRGFYVSQSSWSLDEATVLIRSGSSEEELRFPLARAVEAGTDPHGSEWGVPQGDAVGFLSTGTAALMAQSFYIDAKRERGEVVGRNAETLGTPALSLVLVSGLPVRERPADGKGASPPGGGGDGHASAMPAHTLTELGYLLPGETSTTPVGDVTFVGVTERSGLGIRRDPGVPLVWAGFIGCLLGMVLVFYFPLRQGYVSVLPRQGRECRFQLQVRGGPVSDLEAEAQRLTSEVEAAAEGGQSRGKTR